MNEQNSDQNQTPTPSQPPNHEQGISTTTGLLITLLVAIIAGAGIWYYFNYYLSPDLEKSSTESQINIPTEESTNETTTESETADWKTYTNSEYGYSFKYPVDYDLVDDCYNTQTQQRQDYETGGGISKKWLVIVDKNLDSNFPGCESDFPQMFFIVRASDSTIDFQEQKGYSTTDLESNIKVDDQPALKITMTEPSDFDNSFSTAVHINYNNKSYAISWLNSDAKGTHDSTVDKILETFKFL